MFVWSIPSPAMATRHRLPVFRQFLYLSTVLGLKSKRLAGWSIADHMRTGLVADTLPHRPEASAGPTC